MKRVLIFTAVIGFGFSTPAQEVKTSGQNGFAFSWDTGLTDAMPADVRKVERKMHGGFNEDPKTGEVYTGMPGYGLCKISPDLTTWSRIGDDDRLTAPIHGLEPFYHNGKKYIAIAQNSRQAVLITDGDGKVLQEIKSPKGTEFNFAPANKFYAAAKPKFVPTDVSYMDGRLYVVTGYSPGDFVLTAADKDGTWTWGPIAWGGKGKELGQFTTAHGVMAREGLVYVANRDNSQALKFGKDGENVELIKDLPPGSRVCDVAFESGHFFFCPLFKVTKSQKSAPIYAHTGEKLVSTIIPGDLGIPDLTNIHQAWPHLVKGKDGKETLYILIHGWNKGKYAVLKHEGELPKKAFLRSPRNALNELSSVYLGN